MLGGQGKDAVETTFKSVPEKKLKGRRWKLLDLKFGKFSSTLEGDGRSARCYEHCFHSKASGHLAIDSTCLITAQASCAPKEGTLRIFISKFHRDCRGNSFSVPTPFSVFTILSPNLSSEGYL